MLVNFFKENTTLVFTQIINFISDDAFKYRSVSLFLFESVLCVKGKKEKNHDYV